MDSKEKGHQQQVAGWQMVVYRCWQVRQQLGFGPTLTVQDIEDVRSLLPEQAFALFATMTVADQQHSLRVCRGLRAQGCCEHDMLVAALLHDVGKAQGRVPFWTRPVIVLGKRLAPDLLTRLAVAPEILEQRHAARWRRSLSYAWWHAEVGARLAAEAGLSARAVLYIRTHHQADGPAAELHRVDEVS